MRARGSSLPFVCVNFAITIRADPIDLARTLVIDDDPPARFKGLIFSAANNVVGRCQAGGIQSSDTFALSRVIRHNIAVSNEVRYRQTYRGMANRGRETERERRGGGEGRKSQGRNGEDRRRGWIVDSIVGSGWFDFADLWPPREFRANFVPHTYTAVQKFQSLHPQSVLFAGFAGI